MLLSSTTKEDGRLSLDIEGFMFSGSPPDKRGRSYLNLDQDFIHAAKKLFNPFASARRALVFGRYTVSLSLLVPFLRDVLRHEHGVSGGDTDRKGMHAMDFPPW